MKKTEIKEIIFIRQNDFNGGINKRSVLMFTAYILEKENLDSKLAAYKPYIFRGKKLLPKPGDQSGCPSQRATDVQS